MRNASDRVSALASPVLIGAVTTLVVIVAVYLAYNANQGLPFVPTYDVKAELPNGAKLTPGAAVRVGGFRVGQLESIETRTVRRDGRPVTIALAELALDQRMKPLAVDTIVQVRPRSALGLKYIDLIPGASNEGLPAGGTLPLANARSRVELEDVLSTFDAPTREAAQRALAGYGDALAGRGHDLNRSIAELPGLLAHLTPVMRELSDPSTRLAAFFRQLGAAAAQAAPVAEVQADLFADMATTFAALVRSPDALRGTIERSPETLETAISSFRVQRPFLREFTALSRELVPATAALPRTLPRLNRAMAIGIPVLARVPELAETTEGVMVALDELGDDPNTLLALRNLDRTTATGRQLVSFIAPYQTVCNYWVYWWTYLSEHLSEPVPNGTIQRVMLTHTSNTQDNRLNDSTAERPADVPAGQDPQEAEAEDGEPLNKLNTQFYGPAVDGRGRADCQAGQTGYPAGPLITGGRYPPDTAADGEFIGGGSHVMIDPDTPGRRGGTFKSRELGIDGLEDVR